MKSSLTTAIVAGIVGCLGLAALADASEHRESNAIYLATIVDFDSGLRVEAENTSAEIYQFNDALDDVPSVNGAVFVIGLPTKRMEAMARMSDWHDRELRRPIFGPQNHYAAGPGTISQYADRRLFNRSGNRHQ